MVFEEIQTAAGRLSERLTCLVRQKFVGRVSNKLRAACSRLRHSYDSSYTATMPIFGKGRLRMYNSQTAIDCSKSLSCVFIYY